MLSLFGDADFRTWLVTVGFRQEQKPAGSKIPLIVGSCGEAGVDSLLSRFNFALKGCFRSAQSLRNCEYLAGRCSDSAFGVVVTNDGCLLSDLHPAIRDWLADLTRVVVGRSRFGLMRYRSATVADFHGIP